MEKRSEAALRRALFLRATNTALRKVCSDTARMCVLGELRCHVRSDWASFRAPHFNNNIRGAGKHELAAVKAVFTSLLGALAKVAASASSSADVRCAAMEAMMAVE